MISSTAFFKCCRIEIFIKQFFWRLAKAALSFHMTGYINSFYLFLFILLHQPLLFSSIDIATRVNRSLFSSLRFHSIVSLIYYFFFSNFLLKDTAVCCQDLYSTCNVLINSLSDKYLHCSTCLARDCVSDSGVD